MLYTYNMLWPKTIENIRKNPFQTALRRVVSAFLIPLFFLSQICFICPSKTYAQNILNLPSPGTMVSTSPAYQPLAIKGVKVFADNPFRFDFIVDTADSNLKGESLKQESEKVIKYFLASLTIPEEDLWVNLSPYEKERIIPEEFGATEMGRDLLGQDYILKQLTASLVHPESALGAKFWNKVYKKAFERYGTTEIPVDTFNKVWIVPDKATVNQDGDIAVITESHLKVMLEEDMQSAKGIEHSEKSIAYEIMKEIILPEIEKEINQGKNFSQLRQIYKSMILAAWYKRALKKSILNKVYTGQNKVKGIDIEDKTVKQKIYQQYLEAFKKGVFDYIKKDPPAPRLRRAGYQPNSNKTTKRRYFSGGFGYNELTNKILEINVGFIPEKAAETSGRHIIASSAISIFTARETEKDEDLFNEFEAAITRGLKVQDLSVAKVRLNRLETKSNWQYPGSVENNIDEAYFTYWDAAVKIGIETSDISIIKEALDVFKNRFSWSMPMTAGNNIDDAYFTYWNAAVKIGTETSDISIIKEALEVLKGKLTWNKPGSAGNKIDEAYFIYYHIAVTLGIKANNLFMIEDALNTVINRTGWSMSMTAENKIDEAYFLYYYAAFIIGADIPNPSLEKVALITLKNRTSWHKPKTAERKITEIQRKNAETFDNLYEGAKKRQNERVKVIREQIDKQQKSINIEITKILNEMSLLEKALKDQFKILEEKSTALLDEVKKETAQNATSNPITRHEMLEARKKRSAERLKEMQKISDEQSEKIKKRSAKIEKLRKEARKEIKEIEQIAEEETQSILEEPPSSSINHGGFSVDSWAGLETTGEIKEFNIPDNFQDIDASQIKGVDLIIFRIMPASLPLIIGKNK